MPETVAVFYNSRCQGHQQEDGHPERPERILEIQRSLEASGLLRDCKVSPGREAKLEELGLVHTRDYLDKVKAMCSSAPADLGPDVMVSVDSWEAACLAAGCALQAVEWVMEGKGRRAFCNIRPPGHHALPDQAMGFCIFNNIALAARYAQKKHSIKRILIADWDVHHGNGTQAIFYEEPSVFYFSTHQYPFYPGTGSAAETGLREGKGFTLNVPLAIGSGDQAILGAFEHKLVPAMEQFKPELVLISCGFDAHREDPLGQLQVSDEGFEKLSEIMNQLSRKHCEGRLISLLEGGYNLKVLKRCTQTHLRNLLEI